MGARGLRGPYAAPRAPPDTPPPAPPPARRLTWQLSLFALPSCMVALTAQGMSTSQGISRNDSSLGTPDAAGGESGGGGEGGGGGNGGVGGAAGRARPEGQMQADPGGRGPPAIGMQRVVSEWGTRVDSSLEASLRSSYLYSYSHGSQTCWMDGNKPTGSEPRSLQGVCWPATAAQAPHGRGRSIGR